MFEWPLGGMNPLTVNKQWAEPRSVHEKRSACRESVFMRWKGLLFIQTEMFFEMHALYFSRGPIMFFLHQKGWIRLQRDMFWTNKPCSVGALEPVQPLFWSGPWWHRVVCMHSSTKSSQATLINDKLWILLKATWTQLRFFLGWMV